jgi:hypothetical protein
MLSLNCKSFVKQSTKIYVKRSDATVYEALQDTRPDREQLMKLYIAQIPPSEQIVLAGDSRVLVETVCQNLSRTYLRTFPITIGRSSSDRGIWLQYIGMDTRSTGELGGAIEARKNYQLGQPDHSSSPAIIERDFPLTIESYILVG